MFRKQPIELYFLGVSVLVIANTETLQPNA